MAIAGGTFEHHESVACMPHGPGDLRALAQWPTWYSDCLFGVSRHGSGSKLRGDARKSRIEHVLRHGIALHTDCSGRMTPEFTFEILAKSLRLYGVSLPHDWFLCRRGCDALNLSQDIMMFSSTSKPLHIFSSVIARLPEPYQTQLKAKRPAVDSSKHERESAHEDQRHFLNSRKALLFGIGKTSNACVLHPDQNCPILYEDPEDIGEQERRLKNDNCGHTLHTLVQKWHSRG